MVLLIDDDDDFRQGLAGALRDDGFEVFECAGPQQLPGPAVLARMCLLITDYQMPNRNGLDLADEYHTAYPAVPVVLVTAHWSHQLEMEVAARPHMHLLTKPFDYTELEGLLPARHGR